MNRSQGAATLAALGASMLAQPQAQAHAVAGARVFPVTLTVDDPGVADEASIPAFSVQRQGAGDGTDPGWQYNFGFEWDKTITSNFALGVADTFVVNAPHGSKTRVGFLNLNVLAKYEAWVNAPHEAILSIGVTREFGRTGTVQVGADQFGGTTPTVYAGKGFGDVPISWLRPFAVTGQFGYTVADKKYKQVGFDPDNPQFNNGNANRWSGGLTLQYSLPYLNAQVRATALPEFVNRLVPVVELSWSSPASKPSELPTQFTIAPGVIYMADTYEVGVEALIPGNRASGRNVGAVALIHLFFDDLFPTSIGKPIFQ